MSGTAIAQAIPLLISPVLTRMYHPEDFGILALYMSLAAILSVGSTGRYELAILLPGRHRDAANILGLSILLAFISGLITLVLVILLGNTMAGFFGEPRIGPWFYLLPLTVFLSGVMQAFNYWSTRHKTFRINAAARISQSGVAAATQLGMGIRWGGPAGLILGYILGILAGALSLGWQAVTKPGKLFRDLSRREMLANARKYRNFLRINTPHAIIDSLQDNSIVYVIMFYFTKMVLGSYAFAYRILKAPVGLIGSAMYQVFFQKASGAAQQGQDIRPMILSIYRNLFLIGFPVFTLLFVFSPQIFSFVFGPEWRTSGEIARLLIPWIFMNFLASPVSSIAIIMNRQKEAMWFTLADIIIKISSLVTGGLFLDYEWGFGIMSAGSSLLLAAALVWYYRIARPRMKPAY